jgi:hypothetical protein
MIPAVRGMSIAQKTQKYFDTVAVFDAAELEFGVDCQSMRAMEKKELMNVPGRNNAVMKVKVDIEMLSSFVDEAILMFSRLSFLARSFCSCAIWL